MKHQKLCNRSHPGLVSLNEHATNIMTTYSNYLTVRSSLLWTLIWLVAVVGLKSRLTANLYGLIHWCQVRQLFFFPVHKLTVHLGHDIMTKTETAEKQVSQTHFFLFFFAVRNMFQTLISRSTECCKHGKTKRNKAVDVLQVEL